VTRTCAPFAVVGATIAVLAVTLNAASQAAPCETRLTADALRDLVSAGVPPARLRQLITSCGLDSRARDLVELESALKSAGVPTAALTALAPPPKAERGAVWVSPIDSHEMVFLPAGTTQLGTPSNEVGRDADEGAHTVALDSGFWMDVTEVTNSAYRRFILNRPEWQKANIAASLHSGSYLKNWTGNDFPAGEADNPVVFVSWPAARAYAAWAGKRLPTEAEWEFAARAGTTSSYWWGDAYDRTRVPSSKDASPAKQRTNPWGLRDLLGGVWEWTSSLYRPYPYIKLDGREDPNGRDPRVMRGGSRENAPNFLRSGNRSFEQPTSTSELLGFRCVR
jgi:formylglycine-generating enzyme required for sulfatase activity